jgi:phosphoribosylformylglycinamidine synthase
MIRAGMLNSAHDCSDGGFAVALAECCFHPQRRFGAAADLPSGQKSGHHHAAASITEILFSEAQSRIIVSVAPEKIDQAKRLLNERKVPFAQLGTVGGNELRIRAGTEDFSWPIDQIFDDWWNAIRRAVEGEDSSERIPSL